MQFTEYSPEWSETSRSLEEHARAWSRRGDLILRAGLGLPEMPSPALFNPMSGTVEVNTQVAFPGLEGQEVGALSRVGLTEYPIAGGLVFHESLHACHSTADRSALDESLSSDASTVYRDLEEVRIEGWGIKTFPRDRPYLRASARSIVIPTGEFDGDFDERRACLLVLGREAVGVLTQEDVAPLRSWLLMQDGWDDSILDEVYALCRESAALVDYGAGLTRLKEIANRLDEIMPKREDHESEPGEELAEAVNAVFGTSTRGGSAEAFDIGQAVQAQEARREAEREAQDRATNKSVGSSIFGTPAPNKLINSRPPTQEERSAAILLAEELDKVRYRDREVDDTYSERPPGRLRTGVAMRQHAAQTLGLEGGRYEPFHQRRRVETEEPSLTVAMMSDVSGSMREAQPSVAVANYVVSEAVHRLGRDAKAAQVYYGSQVHPGLKSGERSGEVRTWLGGGSSHNFDQAFRALDGELNLLHGSGARLLFVVSDGVYSRAEIDEAVRWLDACKKWGVAVVWIQMTNYNPTNNTHTGTVVDGRGDLLEVARQIGLTCVTELASASGI